MKLFSLLLIFAVLGFINSPGSTSSFDNAAASNEGRIVYCSPGFDPASITAKNAPLFNLPGIVRYKVTTRSKKAQQYFNQGLTLMYAFNHGESARSFKAAIELDPTFAMAYWGLAMALGPNYNAALNPTSLAEILRAVDNAQKNASSVTEKERALITALSFRFPRNEETDMSPFNEAYSRAMAEVYKQFDNDSEVAAIYADALMNEHPWNFWMKDGTPQPWTMQTLSILEAMLEKYPKHPAIIHLYVHATEASRNPEKALPYADRLADLLPAAGHIVHMPSHTYLRTGDYHKAVLVNEKASLIDSTYISQCRVQGAVPLLYYPHNIHFLAVSAFLEGNSKRALEAAWMINRKADRAQLNDNITVQHYYSIPFYVMVQLAKWDEILETKFPGENLKYPAALWHYARGMAFSAKGNYASAKDELLSLNKLASDPALETQLIWETNTASQLVNIASFVLTGEILAKEGKFDAAFSNFEKAIQIEDQLNYQEPPDWFFSIRNTYGHWLNKSGDFKKSQAMFLEDLFHYPENGYALKGLYVSLKSQGNEKDAALVDARFKKAWKFADFELSSSRLF